MWCVFFSGFRSAHSAVWIAKKNRETEKKEWMFNSEQLCEKQYSIRKGGCCFTFIRYLICHCCTCLCWLWFFCVLSLFFIQFGFVFFYVIYKFWFLIQLYRVNIYMYTLNRFISSSAILNHVNFADIFTFMSKQCDKTTYSNA